MEIIKNKNFSLKESCVTIGKFDGLHIGHQSLFKVMNSFRGKYKLTVFTFEQKKNMDGTEKLSDSKANELKVTSEKDVLGKGDSSIKIYSDEKKESFLRKYGIDYLIEYPFDDETRNTEAEMFVENVLVKAMDVKVLIVGDNFRFGRNRRGDCELLKELSKKYKFELVIVPCIKYENRNVSSTLIREMISKGNFENAERLLADEFWKKEI